ncbi:DUF6279 family lipoprotein [Thalassotalea sp. 1_MG-2023]|uniref:DUF6279 family lipoprotein n=1 Tax=Thalassotalea sp. 1_MG-2023 TaxID=3062680 RepID=UPI0026E23EBA|nr:DUF6279 family lipoprotein [Thalassotalea sp. 1_MG-2023]MDO6426881.1 DUF6279 family lipoprotein [Thalassotalea sp. 1_MG-2023]
MQLKGKIFIILFVGLLTGCSTTFMYNHLDWWVGWYLDDYVDLTRDQQRNFDRKFDELHQWHRDTQLNRYIVQLKQFKSQISEGVSEEDLAEHQEKISGHWQVLMQKVAPEVAQLSLQLSKKQRESLVENIKKIRQKRIDEHENLSRKEWLAAREKEQIADLKEWVGKLTSSQKQKVNELVNGLKSEREYWLAYRKSWQQSFFTLLTPEQLDQSYVDAFTDLMINGRKQLRSEEFLALASQNDAITREITMHILNTLTAKQRKKLLKKLDDLIEDLTELSED